jgi:type III secretion protein I
MDVVLTRLVAQAAVEPNALTLPVGQSAVSPLATARFAEIMGTAPTPVAEAAQAAAAASAVNRSAASKAVSLGDNILAGMQNLSTDFKQAWQSVSSALDANSPLTSSELLKLQMGITQLSVQYDLVGKAISRSTQNLDQLVKMQ